MKKNFIIVLFLLILVNIYSQEISFSFTANHTCAHASLDSVLIENISQGGDTILYYPDTVLSFNFTRIDNYYSKNQGLYVSQNYPNPFDYKTNIEIYVPEPDNFIINVYDLKGSKITFYNSSITKGLHKFTFYSGNNNAYILSVNSNNFSKQILMMQYGKTNNEPAYIKYNGIVSSESLVLKQKNTKSLFPYAIGDNLKFTGFANGDYITITDNSEESKDYFFDIENSLPATPTAKSHNVGETQIVWNWNNVPNATGYKYNTSNNYSTAINIGNNTSYTETNLYCYTNYSLYVWAYNDCGNSGFLQLNSKTSTCPFTCGNNYIDPRDAISYKTIQIGSQCWFAENLKYLPSISHVTVGSYTAPHYYVYGYSGSSVSDAKNTTNYIRYGVLYNWAAAIASCPSGWKMPSDADFIKLEEALGMCKGTYTGCSEDVGWRGTNQGSQLAGNNSLWTSGHLTNTPGFGTSGFNALPAGNRFWDGGFEVITRNALFWTSIPQGEYYARARLIQHNTSMINRGMAERARGLSVRCIKN